MSEAINVCRMEATANGWRICLGGHSAGEIHRWQEVVTAVKLNQVLQKLVVCKTRLSITVAKLNGVRELLRDSDTTALDIDTGT